jgi:hypothetical protein
MTFLIEAWLDVIAAPVGGRPLAATG